MNEHTEYEIEKQKNKQKLVRNEFLYYNNSIGNYELPIIKKQNIDICKLEFLSYIDAKKKDDSNKSKTIHFLLMIGNLKKSMQMQKMNLKN